ncbi:MAG: Cna B-type domain-containing protein [Clostridia bacterium]
MAGEYPEADENREFRFTIVIDGADMEFTLKPGEAREFEVPAGVQYEVREDDYYPEGYSQSVANGYGVTLSGQTVEVIVTNTFEKDRVQMEIEGEKTWELGGYDKSVLPEMSRSGSCRTACLQRSSKSPRTTTANGVTALLCPKYDAEGNEIRYTIEEAPLDCFTATYDGLNIVNTYIPPISVDPPVIERSWRVKVRPKRSFLPAERRILMRLCRRRGRWRQNYRDHRQR